MNDYKVSLEAENDLRDIYRYGIEHYGMKKADAFYHALHDSFEFIASSPTTWPKMDHIRQGYRRYIHRQGRGRTCIYYRLVNDTVEIMTVVQRQLPKV